MKSENKYNLAVNVHFKRLDLTDNQDSNYKFSTDIFLKLLLQTDNDSLVSEIK